MTIPSNAHRNVQITELTVDDDYSLEEDIRR